MKTDERVQSLHQRMNAMRQARERRKTAAIGAASAVLTFSLILLVMTNSVAHGGSPIGEYTGAMMLFENAGGYVLVAIVAFTAAVIITLLCLQSRNKNQTDPEKDRKERYHEN